MGWAFAAFIWAYALFEIPGGWLGDRIGPRRVLMRVVLWWSFFTAATGWVWNLTSLIVTRALFGAGEAGCFPNLTRIFTTWLPVRERERAQAILWFAARVERRLHAVLVASCLDVHAWRERSSSSALPGVIWAVAFYCWYRDDPRSTRRSTPRNSRCCRRRSERRSARGVPWRVILRNRSVWLLCVQYVCLAYGWYFYVTWLPTYLREARGTGVKIGALLAGLPLLLGGIGCLVGAQLIPRVARA